MYISSYLYHFNNFNKDIIFFDIICFFFINFCFYFLIYKYMKYIKNESDFKTDINENLKLYKYKNIFKKTYKNLNLNFYFMSTYGTTISVIYPIFENLVKNNNMNINLTEEDIVLITICVVGIALKDNSNEINKVKNILKEKGLIELVDKGIIFLNSIHNIFILITKNIGKEYNNIIDIFSYTSLYIPFLIAILDLIIIYDLSFDNFKTDTNFLSFSKSFDFGVVTITEKHILNILIKKINRLTKNNTIKENLIFEK